MSGGRPTDCTPDVIEAFEQALTAGFSLMASAQKAGIHVATAYDWRARGKTGEQPFAEFYERSERAKQASVVKLEGTVLKAAEVDPKIALYVLRARNAREWSHTQKHEISGPDGAPVAVVGIDPRGMTDEQIAETLRKLGVGDGASEG